MTATATPATDRQINYLTFLQGKVNKAIDETAPYLIEGARRKFNLDWRHERSLGMTVADASDRISAFHTIMRCINHTRIMCNLKQIY